MDKYFALKLDVGTTADGHLEPLAEIGVALAVPIMVGGELAEEHQTLYMRPAETLGEHDLARVIPGTRIVQVQDPRVEAALLATGNFVETDRPTKTAISKERKAFEDAKQEAGSHNGDPDPTNPDNPVDETKTEA